MAKQIGRQTYKLENPVYIIGNYALAGKKEGQGPMHEYFDRVALDDKMGEESFEKAERRMMEEAVFNGIKSAELNEQNIDIMIGGDLLNQIVTSNYTARAYDIPFLGVYSACSTMTESLTIASAFLDGGFGTNIACVTGSHFSASERQYRNPNELGAQRQTYSQWTVTGMGCTILSKNKKENSPKITHFCIGKVTDFGVKDAANMGAAMAPAAMNTLSSFFEETNTRPEDYDLIMTGDLGKLGSDILKDLMKSKNYILGQNYMDCGHIIFSSEQKTFQGGSGAGCSATVFNSYVIDKLKKKIFNKVLYLATGALMSTTTNQQGDSIPTISHLVVLES